jgi:hypothetical protein
MPCITIMTGPLDSARLAVFDVGTRQRTALTICPAMMRAFCPTAA